MKQLAILNEKLRAVEARIAQRKAQIQDLEGLNSHDEVVADSYRTVISDLANQIDLDVPLSSNGTSGDLVAYTQENLQRQPEGRTIAEMLRPSYQGMTQNEIVEQILKSDPQKKFSTEEIVSTAYDYETEDERKRIRNTIGSTLSRGISKGRWKGANGFYYLKEFSHALFN